MPRSKGIIVTMLGKVTSDVEVSEILPKLQPFFFFLIILPVSKKRDTLIMNVLLQP